MEADMRGLFLALSLLCTASAALAAATPAPPPELEALRKELAAAVKAKDLKAIVALSSFPLAFSGYEAPEQITEADFLSDKDQFNGLFFEGDDQLVACLADGPLEYQADNLEFPDSPWFIDCSGNEYYFSQIDGAWRFTAYMNINE